MRNRPRHSAKSVKPRHTVQTFTELFGLDQRRKWLNRILDVDTHHEAAIQALDKMDYQETVKRNRTLLKVGVGAYVAFIVVGSAFILIATALG